MAIVYHVYCTQIPGLQGRTSNGYRVLARVNSYGSVEMWEVRTITPCTSAAGVAIYVALN